MGATLQQERKAETPLAQSIRESAMRVCRIALGPNSVRWVEAIIRHEMGLTAFLRAGFVESPLALDQKVGRAIIAMDALPESECEALALRYGV